MTPPMVERVARAICSAGSNGNCGCPTKDDGFICPTQIAAALAALRAMREPDDTMNDALDRVPGGFGRGAWMAGINAAINEGK